MVSPSPEWRPLSCGLLSLYQLSAVTGRGACAENSPVLLDQETPVLPITLANWPFSDSTAPGSLSSVPGSPSVSSVCWNPHVKLTKDRDLQDGGSVEALKQKI